MKSNSTQYTSQAGSGNRKDMQPGYDGTQGVVINWALLWSRVWTFSKRTVAELWYLVSRRTPHIKANKASKQTYKPALLQSLWWQRWSVPLFKVTAAGVLFVYVMQRDIQFSIEMKAPLGQAASGYTAAQTAQPGDVQTMGFAQKVANFSSNLFTASPEEAPKASIPPTLVDDYMKRFAPVAQTEKSKYGIPASVKMAQAILESQAGEAIAARVDNNHFGTPMGNQKYESAWRNWREHSLLIVNRHPQLLKLGGDYRAWARGLEKVGYSDSPNYANQLLEIIDRFHLEQLDDSTI